MFIFYFLELYTAKNLFNYSNQEIWGNKLYIM